MSEVASRIAMEYRAGCRHGYRAGAAVAFGIIGMFEAIRRNAPRMCDNCGRDNLDPMFNRVPLPFGDCVGHEFCSGHCYDRFHGAKS